VDCLVALVTGRGLDPGCGVGRDRVSQVLPFSVEVRDGLLLLLVGPVFIVIVGVCQGAGICMVPLWYCSKVWAHVIQLPVYAWVCCSSHRGMFEEACVHYGCWSVDTLVPSLFSVSCM